MPLPTVFHVTHPKAGSQWVRHILEFVVADRLVEPRPKMGHFLDEPIALGRVYPTVYAPAPFFFMTLLPKEPGAEEEALSAARLSNWQNFVRDAKPYRYFVVIRDLRDALISAYFSLKGVHPVLTERIASHRDTLASTNEEEGLLYLMEKEIFTYARVQSTWQGKAELLIKFEDMLVDEISAYSRIFEHCEIEVTAKQLKAALKSNSFQSLSGSERERGEEDSSSHYRKGVSGDWKNHFTDKAKAKFKELYGQLLIDTGYEKDNDW